MRPKKLKTEVEEGDLTPMIDMTFQLIAFFMVLVNFSQADQNDKVQLPSSVLAKPPDAPFEYPITLHVTEQGMIIPSGSGEGELTVNGLKPVLIKEANILKMQDKSTSNATIIIRAHRNAKTGIVQDIIEECQNNKFDKFALRAKEDIGQ